jgi:hypothetical protein
LKIIKLFLFILISFNISSAKNSVIGSYTSRSADTISHLAILPDNKFCLSYMGGNLDLLLAGNWKMQGNHMEIEEVRQYSDMYIAIPTVKSDLKNRIVNFFGRTLSDSEGTIFGVSPDGNVPNDMRLVLESGYNGFEEDYILPLDNNLNKSIFIGFPLQHFADNQIEYKMYQFKFDTPNANVFKVYFNRDTIRPSFKLSATFKNNRLTPDGALNSYESFINDGETLDKKSIAKIKQNCVDPVFTTQTSDNSFSIKPIKVFNVIIKEPTKFYFKMNDEYRN